MTETQVQELAAKLTRVWTLANNASSISSQFNGTWHTFSCWLKGNQFIFRVSDYNTYAAFHQGMERSEGSTKIYLSLPSGRVHHRSNSQEFISQWLPIFRRNCYLSGAPIECTEHEKLEWTLWLREQEEVRV